MEEIRRSWPSNSERLRLQNVVAERLGEVLELLAHESVAPKSRQAAMRASIQQFDFENPIDTDSAADTVIDLLKGGMVHMMHPGYFGLFNPTVVFPAILADLITVSLNPQFGCLVSRSRPRRD